MSVMMKFPKLVSLSKDPHFIMRATMKSKKGIVEVDYENERVRRSPRDLCPSFLSNERKSSMNARTLRVRGFPKTTTLDELLNFFECEVEDVTDVRRYWDGKVSGDDYDHEKQSFPESLEYNEREYLHQIARNS